MIAINEFLNYKLNVKNNVKKYVLEDLANNIPVISQTNCSFLSNCDLPKVISNMAVI
jgi:hypothetical protein